MTLRDIVTCKETSQKLAEAGLPQEGEGVYWIPMSGEHLVVGKPNKEYDLGIRIDFTNWFYIPNRHGKERSHIKYRAWSFSELWDLLPPEFTEDATFYLNISKIRETGEMLIGYSNMRVAIPKMCGGIPHEAAAELLLWVKNEGYLNE